MTTAYRTDLIDGVLKSAKRAESLALSRRNGSFKGNRVMGHAGSTAFELTRLFARSCSAVKACPQVLHLQFAFGIGGVFSPGLNRLLG